MSLIFEIGILVIAAAGAAVALAMLYGALTKPVPVSEGQRLYSVLTVSGYSPELEQTVRGLMWLRSSGVLETSVVIADGGMDEETRLIAELLARDDEQITLCRAADIQSSIFYP